MFVEDSGGGNLQDTYDEGAPAVIQVITLGTAARKGIAFRDAAAPITGNLFEVTDNGNTLDYFSVTPSGTHTDEAVEIKDSSVAVSPANMIRFRSNGGSAQVSENTGAYKDLLVTGDVTLQVAYDSGAAASIQPIVLGTGGRLAVAIRDAAAPIAGDLFAVTNNGGGTEYLSITATLVSTSNTIRTAAGTAAAPAYSYTAETTMGMYRVGTGSLGFATGGVVRARMSSSEFFYTQTAVDSVTPDDVEFVFAANTNVTLSTEVRDFNVNNTRTVTWATGAIVLERAVTFGQPTWAANGASTMTRGVGVDILGAPNAGANMTVTNLRGLSVGGDGTGTVTAGPSAAGTTYASIAVPAHTVTYTNTTAQTGEGSISTYRVNQITVTQNTGAGTLTVASAASIYVSAAPVAGTGTALTETFAILVGNGLNAFRFSDATTTGTIDQIAMSRTSSGAAAIGFGTALLYRLKDDTNLVDAARIAAVWNTVTTASSDVDIIFTTRTAGAAPVERYRFNASTMTSTPAASPFTITATGSTQISIKGTGTAGSGLDNVVADTLNSITAGTIFRTKRAGGNVGIDVSFWGGLQVASGTLQRTGVQAYNTKLVWNSTLTGDNAEAPVMDLLTSGSTMQIGITATLATQRMWHVGVPDIKVGSTNRTITDLVGYQLDAFNVTTNTGVLTATNYYLMRMATSVNTGPSGTTATYSMFAMAAHTITYATATGSTAACGVAGFRLDQITVAQSSGAGTLTVDQGATLYIKGAPLDGTGTTVTNKYAVFVDAGVARFDGDGTFVFELPADATANAVAITGRVPIKVGGATKYFHYFDS
jgi:hypothetical protein